MGNFINGVVRNFNGAKRVVVNNAPTILLVAGVGAGALALYEGIKSTFKAVDIVEEHNERIEAINDKYSEEPDSQECKEELVSVYKDTAINLGKTYWKTAALELFSVSSIGYSYGLINKRWAKASSAALMWESAYNTLRDNMYEKIGQKAADEVIYGYVDEVVEETTTDKKGNEVTKTKVVKKATRLAPFEFWFDETCSEWRDDTELNDNKLRCVQTQFNDYLLIRRGEVNAYEVARELGLPLDPNDGIIPQEVIDALHVYGWKYDKNRAGQLQVDLGLKDCYNDPVILFGFKNLVPLVDIKKLKENKKEEVIEC